MKVAICFSGSIRDFPTCYPSMKRYFMDELNADIFLHLWKMNDISQLETDVDFKWRNDACTEDYVIQCLKPVRYVVDSYSNEWEQRILNESKIDLDQLKDEKTKNYGINACGMYYKIYQSYLLMENYCLETGTQYDLVIRARLDFIWEDHIHLSDFNNLGDQNIFLIRDRYATHSKLATNDKFFAGSMLSMKQMCSLFDHIHHYQEMGFMVEGQTLHEKHIKASNLQVKWIGHEHTYYKCMPRHATNLKNINDHILIVNESVELSDFWYELSYYLLSKNFCVSYANSDPKHDLSPFLNFNCSSNYTHTINASFNGETKTYTFIINNGTNTKIEINDQIHDYELVDFIYSILTNRTFGGDYCFTNKKVIYDVKINDNVWYQYLDRGYYSANVMNYQPKKRYTLKFGTLQSISSRYDFKIANLVNYIDPNHPHLMPTNLLKHSKQIIHS